MKQPTVTVIIPNYNHARYLDERITSVLGQTLQDMEVIILDDASTDSSREVIQKYRCDPRVRVVFNESNSGCVFKQWNKGLVLAQGEYVWIAESDDHADLRLLEVLIGRLRNQPTAGLAFCQSYCVENANAILDLPRWYQDLAPRWGKDFFIHGADEIARYMVFRNTIPNASSAVFRREVATKAGPADESFQLSADWLFWVRLLEFSDLVYVAAPLNYYRFHPNTARNRYSRDGTMVEEALRIAVQILRTHAVDPIIAARVRADLTAWFVETMLARGAQLPPIQKRHLWQIAVQLDPNALWRLRGRRSGLLWLWLGLRRRWRDLSARRIPHQHGRWTQP